jgi:hypothetical protein
MTTQIGGPHDADFSFNQLCTLLTDLGYTMEKGRGSHVTFHLGTSFLSFQSSPNGKAKAYQVRQVRHELPNWNLES